MFDKWPPPPGDQVNTHTHQSQSFRSKFFKATSLLARYCQEPPFRPRLGARSCASCISAWHLFGGVECTSIIESVFWLLDRVQFSTLPGWVVKLLSILYKQLYLRECCSTGGSLHCSLLVFPLRFVEAIDDKQPSPFLHCNAILNHGMLSLCEATKVDLQSWYHSKKKCNKSHDTSILSTNSLRWSLFVDVMDVDIAIQSGLQYPFQK